MAVSVSSQDMPYHLPSSLLNFFTKQPRLCLLKELPSGNVILPVYFENPPEAFVVNTECYAFAKFIPVLTTLFMLGFKVLELFCALL